MAGILSPDGVAEVVFYCDYCAEKAFAVPIPTTIFKVKGNCDVCGEEELYVNGEVGGSSWWQENANHNTPRPHFEGKLLGHAAALKKAAA